MNRNKIKASQRSMEVHPSIYSLAKRLILSRVMGAEAYPSIFGHKCIQLMVFKQYKH